MNEFQINRDDGLPEIESHLRNASLAGSTLVIPNSFKNGGAIGISLAVTQLLLTWARRTPNSTIQSFIPTGDTAAMENFVGRAHGLAAAYLSSNFLACQSNTDIRRQLLECARPRILAMHAADLSRTARGPEIELIFVRGARAEFHGALYNRAPSEIDILDRELHGQCVRDPSDMNIFMARCIETLGLIKQLGSTIRDKDEPFGSLLHETFRNTAEHGYLAANGSRLEHNIRCVRIATALINRDEIAQMEVSAKASQPTAGAYFSSLANKGYGTHDKITFFELSVFDSGPGYTPTINLRTGTKSDDREAVARCFRKHQTAKSSQTAGLGLNRILEVVHAKGGFLRVRTNSAEAFYAPVGDLIPASDPELFVHDGLPQVEGSLITVAIPVAY